MQILGALLFAAGLMLIMFTKVVTIEEPKGLLSLEELEFIKRGKKVANTWNMLSLCGGLLLMLVGAVLFFV